MSRRVTVLGVSRWTADGGSYRTIQRWFRTRLDWGIVLWTVIRTHLLQPDGVYLLAGDDVVVSTAGKATHGVGRFYSSIAGRPIPGLSFLALSLIDVKQRRSYPLAMAQHLTLTATQITDYYPADFISRLGKRLAALSAIRPPTDFQNAA